MKYLRGLTYIVVIITCAASIYLQWKMHSMAVDASLRRDKIEKNIDDVRNEIDDLPSYIVTEMESRIEFLEAATITDAVYDALH